MAWFSNLKIVTRLYLFTAVVASNTALVGYLALSRMDEAHAPDSRVLLVLVIGGTCLALALGKFVAEQIVRPIKALPGTKALQPKSDLIIVRENTEGLYRRVGYIDGDTVTTARCSARGS